MNATLLAAETAGGPSYHTVPWGRDFYSPNNMKDGAGQNHLGQGAEDVVLADGRREHAKWNVLMSPTSLGGPHRKGWNENMPMPVSSTKTTNTEGG